MANENNKSDMSIPPLDFLLPGGWWQFVSEHREEDVRELALRYGQTLGAGRGKESSVGMAFVLDQIQGWQTARKKLPTWAATKGIIYPPHLNMEQCSSERTAKYKQFMIHDSEPANHKSECGTLIDLTGGFGVDFAFLAKGFQHAVYVERNEKLCSIARHNFRVLGLDNFEVVCGDGVEYLHSLQSTADLRNSENQNLETKAQSSKLKVQRTIYLDPARRDSDGRKVYGIEDCTPDVLALKDELLSKADKVMVKLSPMLDWHEAVRKLGDCVSEVHIVSVDNECKELLVVLSHPSALSQEGRDCRTIRLVCVNDGQVFAVNYQLSLRQPSSSQLPDKDVAGLLSFGAGSVVPTPLFLYVPNSSVMKAGIFASLVGAFPVTMVDKNSHLFFGKEDIKDFPGRKFKVVATTTMNKRELREKLRGFDRANITVRNFPLSVAELRKRLKLKDGGDTYLFATTAQGKHIIIVCKAITADSAKEPGC